MSGTLAGLSSSSSMPVATFSTSHEPHSNIFNDTASNKARYLIDRELQRLEDSIRALRSRRNVLAPISLLPPEMLSKIFAYRVAECASTNSLEWIRVTHVSRHWRAVALDCPSLWGNLVFTRPRWSEEMLKRSKMSSLIVKQDLSCTTPKIISAVQLALLHAHRIVDLQLRGSGVAIERLLKRTSDPSFQVPMIHFLSLSVPHSAARFGTDEGFTLPDTVLTGETPHLRRLELHGVNINWNFHCQLLKGLTHLTIRDVAACGRPTTDQLMDALERMPALELFDIQDALPQPTNGSFPDRIVDLPQLAFLNVASTVPECVNLVSRITIPISARVHLNCSGTEITGADFSGVMRVISNPRGTVYHQETKAIPAERIIGVLHVRKEGPTKLVVQGWTNALATHEAIPRINAPDIQLHFSWRHFPQSTVDSVTASICEAMPMAHLRSLRMTNVNGISSNMWIKTFGLLPKLLSLHITGHSAHALIAALRQEAPIEALTSSSVTPEGDKRTGCSRRRSAVPSVYFPQLRSLTMQNLSFEDDDSPVTVSLSGLQSCLIERSQRQAEIRELCLRECTHLYAEHVDALRKLVTTVDWDEFEQGFSEDDESEYEYDGGYLFTGYDLYGEDSDFDFDLDFDY